jgi:membrane protein
LRSNESIMKRIYTNIKNVLKKYHELDGLNLAAALSYYSILSFLPILLIVVAVFGHYLGQSEMLLQKVALLVESILPSFREILVQNISHLSGQTIPFGWLALALLFFVGHYFFLNLEKTVNRIFSSKKSRHFLVTRLLFLVWLVGIVILLSVPSLIHTFQSTLIDWGVIKEEFFVLTGAQWFFVNSWLSFVMVALLVPSRRPRIRATIAGGLIFALLLQAARMIFRIFVAYSFTRYNVIYGSLTALILGALWIFYFSNILILCLLWVGMRRPRRKRG